MHIMYRNSTIDQEMILVKKAAETAGIEYDENNGGLMLSQKSTIKDKNNSNLTNLEGLMMTGGICFISNHFDYGKSYNMGAVIIYGRGGG